MSPFSPSSSLVYFIMQEYTGISNQDYLNTFAPMDSDVTWVWVGVGGGVSTCTMDPTKV